MNILDGKLLASEIKNDLKARVEILKRNNKTVGLGTVLVGEDVGSVKYVAGKHQDCAEIGIESIRVDLPATATETEILEAVKSLNENPKCNSYIVQLPLPNGVDQNKILEAIDPKKDADGLHPFNLGSLVLNINDEIKTPLPCTPAGIIRLVERYLQTGFFNGKNVVVIGRGVTVGRSIGLLLTRKAVNSTVTLCHTGTKNIEDVCKSADVLIAAVGVPDFVKPEFVKDGAVLVDVGVSRVDGKIKGDISKEALEKASWFSPNPGGVGPMTRAMLLENVVQIAERE